jgi:hypothetical protein
MSKYKNIIHKFTTRILTLFNKIKSALQQSEDNLNYNRYLKNLKLNEKKSNSKLYII